MYCHNAIANMHMAAFRSDRRGTWGVGLEFLIPVHEECKIAINSQQRIQQQLLIEILHHNDVNGWSNSSIERLSVYLSG